MESNFEQFKVVFPRTYKYLFDAESNVRIEQEQAQNLRLALESLANEQAKAVGADRLFETHRKHLRKVHLTLEDKIKLLRSDVALNKLNWEKGVILPDVGMKVGKIECHLINGKTTKLGAYDFLRRYGNSGNHDVSGNEDIFLDIQYPTSIKALSVFYAILVELCKGKGSLEKRKFVEAMMPIQGQEHLYFIDEAYVPSDAPMSRCQMEYKAHFTPSGGTKRTEYAIIRQYNKQEAERMFLLRNKDAMRKADDPMDGLPYCVRSSEVLSNIDNSNSPFYIVAYDFQEKPQPLSTELLGTFDMKTRLSLCVDLARGMAEIHGRGIYQRLLTYGNVFICDYSARGKGIHPHLVKFDFAKLEQNQGEDGVGTVLPWAIAARNKIEEESIKKYSNEDDWKYERWEKADIYALGILFCDILSGRINKNREQMEDAMGKVFDSQQLSESFVDFLERMIDDIAEDRPSAMEIQRMAEAEMRKWS